MVRYDAVVRLDAVVVICFSLMREGMIVEYDVMDQYSVARSGC